MVKPENPSNLFTAKRIYSIVFSRHSWFIMLNNKPAKGGQWYEHEHMNLMEDRRIPCVILSTAEAERCYLTHRKDLEEKQRREELKSSFKALLACTSQVLRVAATVARLFVCKITVTQMTLPWIVKRRSARYA